MRRILFCGIAAALVFPAGPLAAQPLDMKKLEGMRPRAVGPATMSGRVNAIAVPRGRTDVLYIGSASGGVWKSVSGGVTWEPITDTLPVASIGALALDPRNPSALWVGTGEGNPRNSHQSGDGVYRSPDGGRTWKHLGLAGTRNIHRVIVHPLNGNVAYVAALGSAWADTPDRGVFRTTDGGASWEKVLYVNPSTGCADLVMDPSNPEKLIAAMWDYRRLPWSFRSGGKGSGLWVTVDGGRTWTRRTAEDGLPKGELGRIGIAIAPADPDRVYALVEAAKNALYRSDDGGATWRLAADRNVGNRPFYYHEIHVDPKDEDRIYNIFSEVTVSNDAGKTFETLVGWSSVHGDHHAWYIDPDNPDFIVDGNDGGVAISYDRGRTWRYVENLPLGQFYHISIDRATPYNIYGGLQDNGSWRGPAYAYRWSYLDNADWELAGGGDGFDVHVDPSDPRHVYWMWQGGYLNRTDMSTGDTRFIRPVHPAGAKLRFNWNAGLATDPFDTRTVYYGSQYLHRSTDRGETWESISPDLTTNDTAKQNQLESGGLTYDVTTAENHCSIVAVAPSPVRRGVLWVGTDDGLVQVTTDGGRSWTNVRPGMKGVPDSTWVPQITPGNGDPAEAFVVLDNHRRNDWTPYLYRTTDYGKSWTRLADEKQVRGYALSFAQDPAEPRLLFLGTEFGLFVSIDAGRTWTRWSAGYPAVSTMDMAVHPVEHDLVLGTFGRSIYVLDDIRPLRELARTGIQLLNKPIHLFEIPEAVLARFKSIPRGPWFPGDAVYRGENRPYGARITMSISPPDTSSKTKATADTSRWARDSVMVEVFDAGGSNIRSFRQFVKAGINRFTWGLDRRSERWPSQVKPEKGAPEPSGVSVLPGLYRIRLTYGPHRDSGMVLVSPDLRLPYTPEEMRQNHDLAVALAGRVRTATEGTDRLRRARRTIERIGEIIKDREDTTARDLRALGGRLQDSIKVLTELVLDREVQGIREDPSLLQSRLQETMHQAGSTWHAPTVTQRTLAAQTIGELQRVINRINTFFGAPWSSYRSAVDSAGVVLVEPFEPIIVEP